jgi:hypothetical protein
MSKSTYFGKIRTAIKKKKQSTDQRGLIAKKNYSSFWMDDDWDRVIASEAGGSSDIVKLIKLSNYRKAVTNFVKIVTKKDILVTWAGDMSYTNGKAICLTTNIKDSNFDVVVGLALHEASHCVLTDFEVLELLMQQIEHALHPAHFQSVADLLSKNDALTNKMTEWNIKATLKNLLNWIEDRRIDHYIFSTSPGYKAYYHKLYDYYWNSNDIHKAFMSEEFSDPAKLDNWLFHIINMISPNFNVKALPRLDEITKIVDLPNIARLNNTTESLDVACKMLSVIIEVMDEYKTSQSQHDELQENESQRDKSEGEDSASGTESIDIALDGGEDESDDSSKIVLTGKEFQDALKAFEKQRDFLNGDTNKKTATKKLQSQLEAVAKQSVELQSVGDGTYNKYNAVLYNYVNNHSFQRALPLMIELGETDNKMRETPYSNKALRDTLFTKMESIKAELGSLVDIELFNLRNGRSNRYIESNNEYISYGLNMGALLGKKLQLHNESRERIDTRLRSGKMDGKRLAHAGYGIEDLFKQIHIDKYKKSNLHISIDASGSMSGDKWYSTVKMTMALAKACTYAQNIDMQVSFRMSTSVGRTDNPVVVYAYDSRVNKLSQLVAAFQVVSPSSATPEGLCFEAMFKSKYFITSSNEVDSYFLNISDGEPQFGNYHGNQAYTHTRRMVDKLRNEYGMHILSFFLSKGNANIAYLIQNFNESSSGRAFKLMYGKDASVTNPESAIAIAAELNKKFLAKKMSTTIG